MHSYYIVILSVVIKLSRPRSIQVKSRPKSIHTTESQMRLVCLVSDRTGAPHGRGTQHWELEGRLGLRMERDCARRIAATDSGEKVRRLAAFRNAICAGQVHSVRHCSATLPRPALVGRRPRAREGVGPTAARDGGPSLSGWAPSHVSSTPQCTETYCAGGARASAADMQRVPLAPWRQT